nr:glycosyltransferase family 2 protein [Pseudomonas luteola]
MNVAMVLNYKAPQESISCAESILGFCKTIDHVVLIDNDSKDGSYEAMKQWKETQNVDRVSVIASPVNSGYAGGNNFGMKWAREQFKVENFWILNNDAYVKDDAFKPLLDKITADKNTIAGSVILSSQTGKIECYGGGIMYPLLGKSKLLGKGLSIDEIGQLNREPDYIMGCSLAFNAEILDKVGYMDESYFMYSEEVDWQHQAKKHGIALYVAPDSQLYHYGSMSSGGKSEFYYYFRNRAATRFNKKFYGSPYALMSAVFLSGITVLKEYKSPKLAWSGIKGAFKGATMHV